MALEVARRLIDGVWQTIVGDDAGSSPGGGDPFNGGTITEPLNIEPPEDNGATDTSLIVRTPATAWGEGSAPALRVQNSDGSHEYLLVADPNDDATVVIRPDAFSVDGLLVFGSNGSDLTHAVLATSLGDGDVTLIDRLQIRSLHGDSGAGSGIDLIATDRFGRVATAPDDQGDPFPGGVFRVMYGGAVVTGQNFEPPTADIAARQVAMWFDPTDGAAKVMFKGKSADGTVVTGNVPWRRTARRNLWTPMTAP